MNLRFPSSDWGLAVHEFTDQLVKLLGKDLVMVVGLDEFASVRDSNVLVVVDKVTEGVRRELVQAELEANDKHDCTISYYVVGGPRKTSSGSSNKWEELLRTWKRGATTRLLPRRISLPE